MKLELSIAQRFPMGNTQYYKEPFYWLNNFCYPFDNCYLL